MPWEGMILQDRFSCFMPPVIARHPHAQIQAGLLGTWGRQALGMPPRIALFPATPPTLFAGPVNATVSTTSLPLQREKRGRKLAV